MKRRFLLAFFFLIFSGLLLGELNSPATSQVNLPKSTSFCLEPAKKHPKLESALSQLISRQRARPRLSARPLELASSGRKVRVIIEAEAGQVERVAKLAEAWGGEVEFSYQNLIQALVPLSILEKLTAEEAVKYIRRPFNPIISQKFKSFSNEVVSQGIKLMGASQWQQQVGLNGKGIKAAVLDIGFKGYNSLLGTELPSSVVVKSFRADDNIEADEAHGTACAEVIHDLIPQAQLFLVNCETEVEWGIAIGWLIGEGVDLISHSMGWYAGPGDGSGFFCEAVERAKANEICWVNAMGNEAHHHWSGSWQDPDGDGFLNFTSQDNANSITVSSEDTLGIFLRWDDPWEASTNDFDLYLLDQNLHIVARSENCQSGFQHPVEWIEYQVPPGEYQIAVKKCEAKRKVNFDLFIYPSELEYRVASGSLLTPADSKSALAVGAVYWERPEELEDFSSQGPTRDGRIKPDFVGPDGVSTKTFSGFFGTSAATPHVAGIIGLIKQLHPDFTPDQSREFLEKRTIDLGETGKDNLFGWGRPNLGGPLSCLKGKVQLEGRNDHVGVKVALGGLQVTTAKDGSFAFPKVPLGDYHFKAFMPGYLPSQSEVKVEKEQIILPSITLWGGDADHDGDVDLADLELIAGNFHTQDEASDINGDGRVDVFDLVLAGKNFGK